MENIPPQSNNFSTYESENTPAVVLLKPKWATVLGVMYIPTALTLSLFVVVSGGVFLGSALMGGQSEREPLAFFICLITTVMVIDALPVAFEKKYATAFSQKEKKIMLIPIPMIMLSLASYFYAGLL